MKIDTSLAYRLLINKDKNDYLYHELTIYVQITNHKSNSFKRLILLSMAYKLQYICKFMVQIIKIKNLMCKLQLYDKFKMYQCKIAYIY